MPILTRKGELSHKHCFVQSELYALSPRNSEIYQGVACMFRQDKTEACLHELSQMKNSSDFASSNGKF
jgi:hypothetical protein